MTQLVTQQLRTLNVLHMQVVLNDSVAHPAAMYSKCTAQVVLNDSVGHPAGM